MRLEKVATGHRFKERMILRLIRLIAGEEPEDVVKTLFYRPEFFGRWHNRLTQGMMRGSSRWTVGERELFAAFVSRLNQCPF
jgi:hypothetical protein